MKRGLYERSEAWGSFHSFSPPWIAFSNLSPSIKRGAFSLWE